MQLGLFDWDKLATGKGFESLARLEFAEARRHFAKVLAAWPEHADASRGLRDLETWEGILRNLEALPLAAACTLLWERIAAFPFGESEYRLTLRRSLLKRLLAMLETSPGFHVQPDLCSGYLCLLLAEYQAAEIHLRALLDSDPDNGRLLGYLADALWGQGRLEAANAAYAAALLRDPRGVAVESLANRRLAAIIRDHGPALAPVHGFLAGILPLIEQDGPPATLEARTYELLSQAEQARHRADHDAMVAARAALKKLFPDILQDYLDLLAA